MSPDTLTSELSDVSRSVRLTVSFDKKSMSKLAAVFAPVQRLLDTICTVDVMVLLSCVAMLTGSLKGAALPTADYATPLPLPAPSAKGNFSALTV